MEETKEDLAYGFCQDKKGATPCPIKDGNKTFLTAVTVFMTENNDKSCVAPELHISLTI